MTSNGSDSKSYFEQQRQLLIGDVAAVSFRLVNLHHYSTSLTVTTES